ncbi:hypothetical protein HNR42_002536 [Deinobacterium chartae]|uniref:DUF4384 domain-containing protein n=1 Tax=Deinobacterium chartae TaxID=521158 RepID=A0A841I3V7_9DEIO|nr:DUF4384 domain-containing protein [Deinobacterium chartae]MBB6099100.1 hypothetical protein [Deinobacterium chartae]
MHKTLRVTALSALMLLSGAAFAQARISPQSIIVNPVETELQVNVWTDKDPSGNGRPVYRPGERIRLHASVNRDAYVYLFSLNSAGQVDLILPNRYDDGDNFLRANTRRAFPGEGDPYTFDVAAPYGVSKVLALASLEPLDIDDIARFENGQTGFAEVTVKTQTGLAQALSIVVNPIPQESWVTDVAEYQVAAPAPAPAPNIAYVNSVPLLRLYPNALPVSQTKRGLNTTTQFETSASLRGVFNYYNSTLGRLGYRRTVRTERPNQISARYVRGNQELRVELQDLPGKRYEISFNRNR